MHKVKTDTAAALFVLKIQKLAHPYPIKFSKLNDIKPTSQSNRSKYRIYVQGPVLWNEFFIGSKKEIKHLSLLKNKV